MVRTAMSGQGPRPDESQPEDSEQRAFANDAWSIPSYILSGMLAYGGIGWLLDRWLHTGALLLVGLLFGVFFALYLVYLRHGR